MLEQILPAWRARRVLLAGGGSSRMRAMNALLDEIGARPVCVPFPADSETLCRTLQDGRTACVIVPDLCALDPDPGAARLGALDMLLREAREAGVPLAMLLSSGAKEDALLLRCAEGFMHGAFGDPVSLQCILCSESSQSACRCALQLGARFLLGDTACMGVFDLRMPSKTE